jgi:O-antigen/teichoic acid export membrane protein
MALNLRRNAVWALVGQAVFAACYWGGFILLGRLGGPEELGRYALALAVVTPVMLFGRMQMRELQVVDATRRHRFEDYLAVSLAGTVCAGVITVAIALLGYAWPLALPLLVAALARCFENLSEVHYGLAQRHKRLDLIARSMILRGVLGLLALGTGYYLTEELAIGLLGMAVAWGLVWWFLDRASTRQWREPSRSERGWQPRLKPRLRLAWIAVPLGVTMLLVTLNPNVPRYFIEGMIGLEALGLFAATAHFVVIGRMIINALCQAASPRLADLDAAADHAAFRWLLGRLLAVALLFGAAALLIVVLFGRDLLGLVYGAQFAEATDLFVWIMLVGAVVYLQTPIGFALTAMHRFNVQPVIFGIPVALNAAACLILVPAYGLSGAVLAWLAAVLCQTALAAVVLVRVLRRAPAAKPAALAGSVPP